MFTPNKQAVPDWIQDDEEKFKALSKRPLIAVPTVALYFFAVSLFVFSTYLGVTEQAEYVWVWVMSALAIFIAFTVLHDASHRAISSKQWVNALFGQLACLLLIPGFVFTMFRFIHMQHHRFTNESADLDPDYWVSHGPTVFLPVKWMFLDLYYFVYYIPRLSKRTKKERREFFIGVISLCLIIGGLFAAGLGEEFLLYQFLPARGAVFLLALAFDYLPHHPHSESGKEQPYQATNVRIGLEVIFTPVLLYQNYHLVHHLHPLVPFYRYIKVWKARQRTMLENKAKMVNAVTGSDVTQDEYLTR